MTYEVISPKDALKMIEDGSAVLIDVREADEFTDMHIPYAISLPMSLIDGMFHHLTFPKDKAIIFQCKMGGRSARVCEYVTQTVKPTNAIYNMDGGIQAWNEAGLITV